MDKRFFTPADIERWVVVVYEQQRRFDSRTVGEMVQGILDGAASVGAT